MPEAPDPIDPPDTSAEPAGEPASQDEERDAARLIALQAAAVVEAVVLQRRTVPSAGSLRAAGAEAAATGLTAGSVVDLYLSAAVDAWDHVTEPVDDTAQAPELERHSTTRELFEEIRRTIPFLVDGYQSARRPLIRFEETQRREFIDDLLRGDGDVAGLVQRAEPFGLDFTRAHQVVMAGLRDHHSLAERDESLLARAVLDRYGDRDVLVTSKGGYLVALIPALTSMADVDDPAWRLHDALSRTHLPKRWRVSVGRPYVGGYGIARSYEEAREAIILAERLHPDSTVVRTRDLLIYRVLGRDRVAIRDLVDSVLTPLLGARGGAEPLLATLQGYFANGEVATVTAQRLHLSVRTVTYRLARIAQLTGHDATDPAERFVLQTAVLGARLLNWPAADIDPAPGDQPTTR